MAVPTIDDSILLTPSQAVQYGEADDRPLLLDAVYPQSEADTLRPPVRLGPLGRPVGGTRGRLVLPVPDNTLLLRRHR